MARIVISQALLPVEEQDYIERNLPSLEIDQSVADQQSNLPLRGSEVKPLSAEHGKSFQGRHGAVRFVKTHWKSPEIMDLVPSIGGLYIVRRPVDVMLSGLNYMYLNSAAVKVFKDYFLNEEPRTVEAIAAAGQLPHYMDGFLRDRGLWPMEFNSGRWVDSVRSWTSSAAQRDIQLVTYDQIVLDRGKVLFRILEAAGLDATPEQLAKAVKASEEATKRDGMFFWRGGNEVKRTHIPAGRIDEIEREMYELAGIEGLNDEVFRRTI